MQLEFVNCFSKRLVGCGVHRLFQLHVQDSDIPGVLLAGIPCSLVQSSPSVLHCPGDSFHPLPIAAQAFFFFSPQFPVMLFGDNCRMSHGHGEIAVSISASSLFGDAAALQMKWGTQGLVSALVATSKPPKSHAGVCRFC